MLDDSTRPSVEERRAAMEAGRAEGLRLRETHPRVDVLVELDAAIAAAEGAAEKSEAGGQLESLRRLACLSARLARPSLSTTPDRASSRAANDEGTNLSFRVKLLEPTHHKDGPGTGKLSGLTVAIEGPGAKALGAILRALDGRAPEVGELLTSVLADVPEALAERAADAAAAKNKGGPPPA